MNLSLIRYGSCAAQTATDFADHSTVNAYTKNGMKRNVLVPFHTVPFMNMSAYADQNHAPSLTDVRLELTDITSPDTHHWRSGLLRSQ